MKINSKLVKSENIKVYASEAKLYDELHPELWNWYEQKLYQRLVNKTLEIIKGKKNPVIVDVGAGTGNLTLKYLEAGCKVISIDISKEMLRVLEAKLTKEQKKKCTIINSDIESALLKIGRIDGVCFSAVLHHLYDYVSVTKKIVKKMNPNSFFFNVHDPLVQVPKSKTIYKIHSFIRDLDESLYRWNIKRKGYDTSKLYNDSIAECHQKGEKEAIDVDKVLNSLKKMGLKIEHFGTHASRRYGFFSWYSSEIIKSENDWECIAKK